MADHPGIGILVAGGSGTRMNGAQKKQYMELAGKPLMYYALAVMERSPLIQETVLVVSPGDEAYVRKEIVARFAFSKVCAIVPGGKERYHSVYAGLCAAKQETDGGNAETIVYIQDAARPFLTEDILRRVHDGVVRCGACVAAMPVKDTIKQADGDGIVTGTPDRKTLWAMQTPQAFRLSLVSDAYTRLIEDEKRGADCTGITDDAMVVERYVPGQQVLLVEGSYGNIKITTQEDLAYAQTVLS